MRTECARGILPASDREMRGGDHREGSILRRGDGRGAGAADRPGFGQKRRRWKTMKLKMAMAGGGAGSFIGRIHRLAVGMDGLADVVAGAFSRDPAVNAATGAELGVAADRTYADWRAMIASEAARPKGERADFVAVCTPNHLHHPIAKAALEAGFHVMCEKPVALTVAEAEELARLAKRRRRAFAVMHTYAGYPMVKLARDLVRRGDLGRICKVVCEYQQGSFRKLDFSRPLDKRNRWKTDPKFTGESCCMGDIGVHAANLVEYVTGLRIREVLADLSNFAAPHGLDDDGSVLLRLEKGAKGVIVASKIATGEENGLRLSVYGEKKGLAWRQEDANALKLRAPFEPEQTWTRASAPAKAASPESGCATRVPAGHPEGFIAGMANVYRGFCEAVRAADARRRSAAGALDFPDAEAGVRGMRFVEATLKSSRAGGAWTRVAGK